MVYDLMIGVILAAGRGSRLNPLTHDTPKCLVEVCNKKILQYQLDAYKEANIKRIIIVIGYKANDIVEYCKNIDFLEITFIYNETYKSNENMYSLYLARNYLKGKDFILNNADLCIDKNLIKNMLKDTRTNLIAVDNKIYTQDLMKIILNKNKQISNISKNITQEEAFGCAIDFYKISSVSSSILFDKIIEIIELNKDLTYWFENAFQQLFNNESFKFDFFDIKNIKWFEVDNTNDLLIAEQLFYYEKTTT
jgi:choline kinase